MSELVELPSWTDSLETTPQRSIWADAFERFRQNRLAIASLVFVIFLLLASLFGPLISPWGENQQDLTIINQPPTAAHWFGTDGLGRDYLTRIVAGGRTAFSVAIFVAAITTVLGVSVGAASAYYGGWVDTAVMRVTDGLMSFPSLLLALFVVGMLRPPVAAWMDGMYAQTRNGIFRSTVFVDYVIILGALAMIGWPGMARLVRGQVLSLSRREFIEAERAIGAPSWLIIKDHLIPNALGPVVVAVSASLGGYMLAESSLSYLGLGIQPPGSSWGNMINENLAIWRHQPHLIAGPGVVLALAILAFNFIGDGINDALNPRGRRGKSPTALSFVTAAPVDAADD